MSRLGRLRKVVADKGSLKSIKKKRWGLQSMRKISISILILNPRGWITACTNGLKSREIVKYNKISIKHNYQGTHWDTLLSLNHKHLSLDMIIEGYIHCSEFEKGIVKTAADKAKMKSRPIKKNNSKTVICRKYVSNSILCKLSFSLSLSLSLYPLIQLLFDIDVSWEILDDINVTFITTKHFIHFKQWNVRFFYVFWL